MSTAISLADVVKLLDTKRTIEDCLRSNREQLEMLQRSRSVNVVDLLKESLQIQFNCHAPKEYTIGMPLFKGHPPAPQPEEMRLGALSLCNKAQSKHSVNESKNPFKAVNTIAADSLLSSLRNELSAKRNRLSNNQLNFSSSSAASESITDQAIIMNSKRDFEEDNLALKKARTVNISFGMSDSEESDTE